jgi:hypothetical protein
MLSRGPIKPVLKLSWNIFRSVMFLTTYILVIIMGQEVYQHRPFTWLCGENGMFNRYNRSVLACVLATAGIAWEQPHRRIDIIYYIIPRVLEIYWNMIKNRKVVKGDLPFQNAIIIGFALAVVAYKYSEET